MSKYTNTEIDILIKEKQKLLKKINKEIKTLREQKMNPLRTQKFITKKELENDMEKLYDDIDCILKYNNIDTTILGEFEYEAYEDGIIKFEFIIDDDITDELKTYVEPILNKIKYMNKINNFKIMELDHKNDLISISYKINIKL